MRVCPQDRGCAVLAAALATLAAVHAGRDQRDDVEGFIVGGSTIDIQDVPWQVSVHMMNLHFCGGSIISMTHVLTAAHCIHENFNYKIVAGTHNLAWGDEYIVVYMKKHEHFDMNLYYNDVAIMKISGTFRLGRNVKIASLATQRPPAGSTVLVSGWGSMYEGGKTTDVLRAVEVTVLDLDQCRECYYGEPITEQMLCAATVGGGKDACQGDSGGPLSWDGVVVGVVSFGKGCARPQYPGVYADVVSLRSWIVKNANLS